MSLVQLFVNGTLVFSDTTDDVDALVVKVDGNVLVRTSRESRKRTKEAFDDAFRQFDRAFRRIDDAFKE